MNKNIALRAAGIIAMATSLYHGYEGNRLINGMGLDSADLSLVSAFTQIGTMGWMAGGVLLIAAGSMRSKQARNWIVGVMTALYGFPAFGSIALSGGNPGIGGIGLALVVVLALYGRSTGKSASPAVHAIA